MKKLNLKKIKKITVFLFIIGLTLGSAWCMEDEEATMPPTPQEERQDLESNPAEYAPGHLIVKLKEGKALDDLKELNDKYQVISSEKVFQEIPDPKGTLANLKDKFSKLGAEHQSWYWQLDKDSQEYKDYIAKIEKEKEDLQKQIQAQEELIAHLEQREKRAPEGATPPDLTRNYLLKVNPDTDIPTMAVDYSSNPAVEYAEPDYIVKVEMIPNDPYYSSRGSMMGLTGLDDLWGLKKIEADRAWDITQGEGVIVAVVDTGIDYNHPDIKENIWINKGEIPDNGRDDDNNGYIDDVKGYDFADRDSNPIDGHGHGTHVAGTIAAVGNNNIGIIGVAPKAKVMALKGSSGNSGSVSAAEGLYYAANMGADVINNSWGGVRTGIVSDAVSYAVSKGCAVVASAGNASVNTAFQSPANLPGVITVAASNFEDKKENLSNYGPKIDVAAPGVDILSLLAANSTSSRNPLLVVNLNYVRKGGTSMAAPHVAGVAALILAKHPDFSSEQVRYVLRNSSDDIESSGWDINSGYGRVNAQKAVSFTATPPKLYADITSPSLELPAPNNIYNKEKITIKGSAGGSDFSGYKLEYAKYSDVDKPVFNIITSNTNRVSEGTLGEFDTSSLENGRYLIRLTVYSPSGLYTEGTTFLYIDNTLKTGWPKIISMYKGYPLSVQASEVAESLVFADLDNDGYKEVITVTGKIIFVLRHDGSIYPNFPVWVQGYSSSTPAVADLDKDGKMEIIAAASVPASSKGIVHAFHSDGKLVNGFPAGKPDDIPGNISLTAVCPAVVADLEGDGNNDIVVTSATYNRNYPGAYLLALDNNGNKKQGWPVILSRKDWKSRSPVSVADLDNDGKQEIIVMTIDDDTKKLCLNVYSYDGKIKNKAAFDGEIDKSDLNGIEKDEKIDPLLIGDVDNNGKLEIFIAIGETGYLLDNNGKLLSGWPKAIAKRGANDSYVFADLDGDLDLEILGVGGNSYRLLYAYHHDGLAVAGFPKEVPMPMAALGFRSPIVVGNIYKSPEAAMFFGRFDGAIYGVNNKGEILENWPKSVPPTKAACAVADLDGDGLIEIGVRSSDGMVYIWQEKAAGDEGKYFSWPTLYGNNQRTGALGFRGLIDKTPPVTVDSGIDGLWHKEGVTVTLSANDTGGSGVDQTYYSLDGITPSILYSAPFTVSEEGAFTLKYYSQDKLGHKETVQTASHQIKIEKSAPVTTDSGIDGAWHKSVTVTLTAADKGSGVDQTYYSLDGTTPSILYSAPFIVSEEGVFTLKYYSQDRAGNKEAIKTTSDKIKIDKGVPVTTDSGIDGLWHKEGITVTLSANDTGGSGVEKTYYSLDGTEPKTIYSAPFTVSEEGEFTLKYYSQDKLGHKETVQTASHQIKIEKSAPVTTDSGIDGAWHKSVTVTLTAADKGSGVDQTYYSLDGTTPSILYSAPFTVSEEGEFTLKYYSQDKLGNQETVKTASNQIKIEKATPVTVDSGIDGLWHNSSVTVTLTATDTGSGVGQTYYSLDGITPSILYSAPFTVSEEGAFTLKYYSQDKLGHKETVKTASHQLKIEKSVPVTTDSGIDGAWHKSVTVTLTAADKGSGVEKTYYSLHGGEPRTIYTGPFTVSEEGVFTLKYYSQDRAGNTEKTKAAAKQIKIDDGVPSKPRINVIKSSPEEFTVYWLAKDKQSGISEYRYRVIEGSREGKVIRDWESVGNANAAKVSAKYLNLTKGKNYYFAAKAKNGAGVWSETGYSDAVTLDSSAISNIGMSIYGNYYRCYFRLDQKAKVTAQIWSADGKVLVYEFAKNVQKFQGYYNSLGFSFGNILKEGSYMLKLSAVDSSGKESSGSKAFSLKYNSNTKKYYIQ